ncbi:MarR family transcriptional regulator [Actinoplanes sp. NPDC049596]|uniref:MarR family winged helix-turn-helix transcriptional regulator n=1 Tax=unclassified Actinoplanes TaxID=2626549 RepID=UPI003419C31C
MVFSRLRRRLREVAKLDELTPSQTSVLSRLEKGGAASSSELAVAEQVRPQSMAATIAAIEQVGLVMRTPDPGDGRKQLISLSELGREKIGVSRQAREEWMARALADDFSEEERQAILAALPLLDRLAGR